MSALRYRADIDGLRAIAVLPVLAFHLGYAWMPGGFMGVDVFFVISGYLITSLILLECAEGRFSFRHFWARRIRRIFPVLALVVLVTLVAAWFLAFRPLLADYGEAGLAAVFSVANIYFYQITGSYWGMGAKLSPFLHTWSLSVEEQFYLVLPILLVIVLRYLARYMLVLMTVGVAVSFAMFCYTIREHPIAGFYLLPTRAWELGIGCLLAYLLHRSTLAIPPVLRRWSALPGLLLIAIGYLASSEGDGFTLMLVLPVLGSAMVLLGEPSAMVARLLATRPFVFVGKISYSLYMWHWPAILLVGTVAAARNEVRPDLLLVAGIFAVSIASYLGFERPIRQMRHAVRAVVPLAAAVLITSIFLVAEPFNTDHGNLPFPVVQYYGPLYDLSPIMPADDDAALRKRRGIFVATREPWAEGVFDSGGIRRDYGGSDAPRILLLGDSHILMWSKTIDEIGAMRGYDLAFNGMSGTSPFFEIPLEQKPKPSDRYSSAQKYAFDLARYTLIDTWRPDLVVIAARWSGQDPEAMVDLLDYIGEKGGQVLLISQPPVLYFGNQGAYQYLGYLDGYRSVDPAEPYGIDVTQEHRDGRAVLERVLAYCSHCHLLDIAPHLLDQNDQAMIARDGIVFYFDDDHLSYQGAQTLRSTIDDAMLELLPASHPSSGGDSQLPDIDTIEGSAAYRPGSRMLN